MDASNALLFYSIYFLRLPIQQLGCNLPTGRQEFIIQAILTSRL